MSGYKAVCEFCGLSPYDDHINRLCTTAAGIKARKDFDDGLVCGQFDPYYPKAREDIVLANMEKVSPQYVRGYKRGKAKMELLELQAQLDDEDPIFD